jgi:hypothetical protein
VTAKVTRDASNTVYKPAVSIRSGCALTDELVCARDSSGISTATATLPPGTYFVFVDGVGSLTPGSNYGPFTLEIATAPPIPGDSCGSAIPIAIDPISGIGTATGDLSLATKSTDGSCLVNTGNDLVYGGNGNDWIAGGMLRIEKMKPESMKPGSIDSSAETWFAVFTVDAHELIHSPRPRLPTTNSRLASAKSATLPRNGTWKATMPKMLMRMTSATARIATDTARQSNNQNKFHKKFKEFKREDEK